MITGKDVKTIKGDDQRMVQIGKSSFYLTGGAATSRRCILLKKTRVDKNDEFQIVNKASMIEKRIHHSACSQMSRYIVVSGTRNDGSSGASVERYDTLNDSWELLPSLNIGRYRHASCSL